MCTTIAVVSDIHGNSPALAAVLAEISRKNITRIINLGDTLYGPLDPIGTFALLRGHPCPITHIRGNGDRVLAECTDRMTTSPTVRFTLELLTDEHMRWLDSLPDVYADEYIFACHGAPHSDEEYLLEELHEHGTQLHSTDYITQILDQVSQPLILCGHSHLPHVLYLPGGKLVVNPGSVGLPAYTEDAPKPHKMESGSPHARCALITGDGIRWSVEQLCIPYDWQKAAKMAETNGRPDWAVAIGTGRV